MDLIQVTPDSTLIFRGPYDQPCSTAMTITNRSSQNVLYKVKTTAPKSYCVRPNAAKIAPKESATISVILQPNASEPVTDKTRHRFMVQAVGVAENAPADVDQFWKQMPQDKIQDLKLRVVFEGLTTGASDMTKQLLPEEAYATLGAGSGGSSPVSKTSQLPAAAKQVPKMVTPTQKEDVDGPRHRHTAQPPSANQSSASPTGFYSAQQTQPQSSWSMPVILLLLLLYSLLLLGAGYAFGKYL